MTAPSAEHDAAVTDRAILIGSAYDTGRDLSARQSLYQWQTPRYDLPGIVVEHLRGTRGTVVDVGCGNGKFIERLRRDRPDLRLLGLDVSFGILAGVPRPVAVADAARLPWRRRASTVCSPSTCSTTSRTFRRRSGTRPRRQARGVVLASTNSARDKTELDQLWERAAGDVLGVEEGPGRISLSARFSLERASSLLGAEFGEVETVELPGTVVVRWPDPVIAHLASYRAWAEHQGVPFEETVERAREIVSERIERDGTFEIGCLGGMLVCSR